MGKNRPGPTDFYPERDRFPKLSEPISYSSGGRNLWATIPIFGSSIIPIIPRSESEFVEAYGFSSIRDLEKLLDLAKTSGRVQFVLTSDPTNYAGMDFLDSLFKEMRPPYVYGFPSGYFASEDDEAKWRTEFLTIAKIRFIPYLRSFYESASTAHFTKRVFDYAEDYVTMKASGYDELAESMLNVLIDNPSTALSLYTVFGNLLAVPMTDPMDLTYHDIRQVEAEALALDLKEINKYLSRPPSISPPKDVVLPHEVGKFLMNKLTYLPEGYEACLAMMDRYAQEDLQKLLIALQQGCTKNNIDELLENSKALGVVLDNLCRDSKQVKSLTQEVNYGFIATFGVVGTLATLPFGGIGGILAGLGYEIANKKFSLSEKVTNSLLPNHLVMINDFKTKYAIA